MVEISFSKNFPFPKNYIHNTIASKEEKMHARKILSRRNWTNWRKLRVCTRESPRRLGGKRTRRNKLRHWRVSQEPAGRRSWKEKGGKTVPGGRERVAAGISRIMGRNGQIIERLSSTPTLLHEIGWLRGLASGLPCTWIAPCQIILLPLCLRLQESRDGGCSLELLTGSILAA